MKTQRKDLTVTREYWTCLDSAHHHTTPAVAEACIQRNADKVARKAHAVHLSIKDNATIWQELQQGARIVDLARRYNVSSSRIIGARFAAIRAEKPPEIACLEGLSTRAKNILLSEGITTFADAYARWQQGDMPKIPNCGRHALAEISQWLAQYKGQE